MGVGKRGARRRSGTGFAVLAVVGLALGAGATPLAAQETVKDAKPAPAEAPKAKRAYDPTRRVPPYFGQVGLTADQKEAIYKARGKHQAKIEDLQKQLAEAQSAMMAECESLLTGEQRNLLADKRRQASSKARGAAPTPPSATAEAKASGPSGG